MADKDKSKDKEEKSIKIQDTFLKERKVFLWGEVSDKSARDVTEKLPVSYTHLTLPTSG